MTGIYKITSPTGRIYIGQAVNVEKRWADYRRGNAKFQTKLKRSFFKYGVEAHIFEILIECPLNELNQRERYYQDLYEVTSEKGLNCVLTKTDTLSGVLSEEVKQKIGIGNKGKLTGKRRPEGCVEKRLETRKLNGVDDRISTLYTNRKLLEETISKISQTLTGRKHSLEHIKNNAEAKYKPILHVGSGIIYQSRKEACEVFGKCIDYSIKKGIFRYV